MMRIVRSILVTSRIILLDPKDEVLHPGDKQEIRLLSGILLALTLVGFLYETAYLLNPSKEGTSGFIAFLFLLPPFLLFYVFGRKRHYRRVVFLLACLLMLAMYLFYFFMPVQSQSPYFLLLLTLPILLGGHYLSVYPVACLSLLNIPILLLIVEQRPQFEKEILVAILPALIIVSLLIISFAQNRKIVERDRVAALLEHEARFRMVLEKTFEGISIIQEGRIREVNAGFSRMFQYSAAEAADLPIGVLFTSHEAPFLKELLSGQPGYKGEQQMRRKDGSDFFAEVIWYGNADEVPHEEVLAFRDVTARRTIEETFRKEVEERRHTENALLESQRALQQALVEKEQLLAAINSILIGVDREDTITHWNDAAALGFGIAASGAIGKKFHALPIAWDWSRIDSEIDRCQAVCRRVRVPELSFAHPNGSRRTFGFTLNPIIEDNLSKGFLILGSDITDQVVIKQQLEQRNKLESIGQLAAGIAHEINTPAQFISGNLRFLREHFSFFQKILETVENSESEEAAESRKCGYLLAEYPKAIDQSIDGINRISSIVLALRDFSHPGSAKRSLSDINKGLESTIAVARNEWKYVAEVETKLDRSLPLIDCYPGELNQAFLNILINAVHAIKDSLGEDSNRKGRILIETKREDGWVEVRIGDTGTGIPAAIRERIFDPFFTTKEIGRGTGQGLYISHAIIVQKHSGTIHCESEEGKGTTFFIRLPIHPATPEGDPSGK